MSYHIKIPTHNEDSEILAIVNGRNGIWEITAISLNIYNNIIYIDGYGKRDTMLNGGFRVSRKNIHDLCVAFLEYEESLKETEND